MAWFRIVYAKNAFVRSAGDPARLTPASGLRAMAVFYREHRAQHAAPADGDDVLEFRWERAGDEFEVAVLRRLRRHGSDGPERVLRLAWRFARSAERDAAASGHLVVDDPARATAFVREVTASAAWAAVRGARPRSFTIVEE